MCRVTQNWNLRNQKMLLCDVILQFGIFFRVFFSKRCTDNGNCPSSGIQGGTVSDCVDAGSQTRHYRKILPHYLLCKPCGPFGTFLGWFSASNHREAPHFAQFPCALIVEQFDRMFGVSQFCWIIPSLVYANAEPVYSTPVQLLDYGCGGFVGLVPGHEVRRQCSFIGSKFLR